MGDLENIPPQFQGLFWYLGLILGIMGVMLVLRWILARISRERQDARLAAREQMRDQMLNERLQAFEIRQEDILERLERLESRFGNQTPPPPE